MKRASSIEGAAFPTRCGGARARQYVYVDPSRELLLVITAEPTVAGDEIGIAIPTFAALRDEVLAAFVD